MSAVATNKARILVVDDHPIVCEGLGDLIDAQPDVVCCGRATTLSEAEQAIAAQRPDMVLLDLRLGNLDGLESIKRLRAQFGDLAILVLSQFDETVYAEQALRAGALGYLMKEQATEELLRAIHTVLSGQVYVSSNISSMAIRRLLEDNAPVQRSDVGVLSDRELSVFRGIGSGKSNKEIAAELELSVKTVETYREHIKFKLGLSGAAELSARAREELSKL